MTIYIELNYIMIWFKYGKLIIFHIILCIMTYIFNFGHTFCEQFINYYTGFKFPVCILKVDNTNIEIENLLQIKYNDQCLKQ